MSSAGLGSQEKTERTRRGDQQENKSLEEPQRAPLTVSKGSGIKRTVRGKARKRSSEERTRVTIPLGESTLNSFRKTSPWSGGGGGREEKRKIEGKQFGEGPVERDPRRDVRARDEFSRKGVARKGKSRKRLGRGRPGEDRGSG